MLCGVGNVTLPTPVFIAGGVLCLVTGYVVGSVTAPASPDRSTAKVVSFDPAGSKLCLEGDAVKENKAANSDGELCGTWRRTPGSVVPTKNDRFRFVTVSSTGTHDGKEEQQIVIYGNVVRQVGH